jgi:hypothetical protein
VTEIVEADLLQARPVERLVEAAPGHVAVSHPRPPLGGEHGIDRTREGRRELVLAQELRERGHEQALHW